MRKRNLYGVGMAVFCALVLAACGNRADTGTPNRSSKDAVSKSADENKVENTNDSAIENKVEGTSDKEKKGDENVKAPEISFEILSDTRTDSKGKELLYAQYPVFSVSGEGYEALAAVLGAWNEEFKNQADSFLDERKEDAAQYRESVDASYQYGQKSYVSIQHCDGEFVSIVISREVEEGGSHPNYYSEALNFFSQTGALVKLEDIITVDNALNEKIKEELYKNYPELEFDDALLEKEIADALAEGTEEWYFTNENICISFPEGSFGFGHAEGSLGVLIPAKMNS